VVRKSASSYSELGDGHSDKRFPESERDSIQARAKMSRTEIAQVGRVASLRAGVDLISWYMPKRFLCRACQREVVSPKAFLGIIAEQRQNIARVEVRPAKLGTNGFGKLVVRYKIPVLKPQHAG
jgi:hypothetical protein